MDRYRDWLVSEGQRAGGIGPGEADRVDHRHLGDSLLFASQLPADIDIVWDLGSGVGLPGIPLAICLPETEFALIDRSGRRCQLMQRVIRILDLRNCHVEQAEVENLTGRTGAIVSRAFLPPDDLAAMVRRHLDPGGVAVIGGSWRERPTHQDWTTVEIPADALDQTIWLLIMRRQ
jgi:16S rRNA (guanine527-N7)-methyltransferase